MNSTTLVPNAASTCTESTTTVPDVSRSFADAADALHVIGGDSVRAHLYAYRGVLGMLPDAETVATFVATDGYRLFDCAVRLVSLDQSTSFYFRAVVRQEG